MNLTTTTDMMTYYNPDTKTVGYWIEKGKGGDFYTTSGEYSGFYDDGKHVGAIYDAEGIEIATGTFMDFQHARRSLSGQLLSFETTGELPEDLQDVMLDGEGGYIITEYVEGETHIFLFQEDLAEGGELVRVPLSQDNRHYSEVIQGALIANRASKPFWTKEMKGLYVSRFNDQILTVEKDKINLSWDARAMVFYPDLDDEIVQYTVSASTKEDAMNALNTYIMG